MSALLLLGAALAADPVASWTLDDSDGGFVTHGDTDQWQYGAVSSGPGGGYTGANAWSTGLDRLYYNDSTDYLQLPNVDLTGVSRPVLSFFHWYDIDNGGDAAWLEIWDGSTWNRADPVYGYSETTGYTGPSNGWHEAYLDLTGLTDAASVRFVFSSDARVAASGWFLDDLTIVDGDPVPPQITAVTVPTDTEDVDGPYPVEVDVEDDLGSVTVSLSWGEEGEDPETLTMEEISPGRFRAEIPGADPDTDLTWRVQATDGTNSASYPEDASGTFRVYLAAPSDLTGPEGRVVGTSATLTWTAPDSAHEVVGYRLYLDGEAVAESVDTSEDVPLRGPVDTFEVSALYTVGEGDRSAPLLLHTNVPEITLVEPAKAWQGDCVRVAVRGDYLLLSASDAALDLGDDIAVTAVNVVDADSAIFTLQIDDVAAEGTREATLQSGDMEISLPDGFTVLPYADRPALVSVSPDTATQGESVTVQIKANIPLVSAPLVDLGEGVFIESVEYERDTVTVYGSVAWTAAVGVNDVTVDDGSRIIEGAQFRVRNATTTPEGTCSTAPTPRGLAGLLGLAVALSLRARRAAARRR